MFSFKCETETDRGKQGGLWYIEGEAGRYVDGEAGRYIGGEAGRYT